MGFKPDLNDQLVSFTVGLVIWPVKIVPEITYNVLSRMLSLYTTTTVLISGCSDSWQCDDDVHILWSCTVCKLYCAIGYG